MDVSMMDMAVKALVIMADPMRLMYLGFGVLIGLVLGVIPGLGGIVGLAILLPFTFSMDPYSAFAMLLGMGSVTTTSDTIPAVLFGVPGTSGSAATILDGHPLAKRGEAGRAFGAAYSASLLGGIFGAALLAVSIPILRPVMLYLGSPELLAFAIFGLSMVAALSGSSPLRGLAIACFGLMISFIGVDPQTGTFRWTGETIYLWEGLPLVPVSLGLFALPELADMAIARRSIAGDSTIDTRKGQWEGVKDTFRHWWLLLRVAWLGASLGAIPGLGGPVVDWIAYGHGARTEKGGSETFGTGDIRGVISSEGANNAKEGGALVPTVAFGVPGSAGMAILLGAFLIHGLIPGPDMLNKNLDVTYTMVWSVALANILGAGICFMFSDQFAKLAMLRYSVLMPVILTVVFVGAFQGTRQWGDIYALLFFGILGWILKRMQWPRPPLILGVVLGDIVERYMFVSIDLFGFDWIWRPVVIAMFALSFVGLTRPFVREIRYAGGITGMLTKFSKPVFDRQSAFYLVYLTTIGVMIQQTTNWEPDSKIAPLIVAYTAVTVALVSFINHTFRKDEDEGGGDGEADEAKKRVGRRLHFDLTADTGDLDNKTLAIRAVSFFGWLVAFLGSSALIGMLPTAFIFVIAYMRVEGKEPWRLTLMVSAGLTLFSWMLFDQLLSLPWPQTLGGDTFPDARYYIPSL